MYDAPSSIATPVIFRDWVGELALCATFVSVDVDDNQVPPGLGLAREMT